jgi:hypothetical protein
MKRRRPLVRLVLAVAALLVTVSPTATAAGSGAVRDGAVPDGDRPLANPIVTDIYTADPATLVVDEERQPATARRPTGGGLSC